MTNAKAQKLAGTLIDYLKSTGEISLLPELTSLLTRQSAKLGLENAAVISSPVKLDSKKIKALADLWLR